ncbi:MAG: (Fe-S)-binding protein [Candidatus Lokiarchaeota archaeon]|nr:(Fe-S)-binding protein [Candidatus Lokiarchaeota archaeon]
MNEKLIEHLSSNANFALPSTLDRCIRCNTCKYAKDEFFRSCPSGEKFLFESFWASGRIKIARGILNGDIPITNELYDAVFACPTCGACEVSCQAPHQDTIVNIIESLRELIVDSIGAPERPSKIFERVQTTHNPYNEPHFDMELIKRKYILPDKANIVYFIGCTSTYRQQTIRDATLSVLKKLGIDFTIVNEYCCGSPLIRTGQIKKISNLMQHNVDEIRRTGATMILTSCAGCYRTLFKDFPKYGFGFPPEIKILHTSEFLNEYFKEHPIPKKENNVHWITYHDPCHLGRHMGIYEAPRELIAKISNLDLIEMKRNREFAWCCGSGGGVKIGYPDWATEVAFERIEEARETGVTTIVSTCPFCKTNLEDANKLHKSNMQVLDLIEILDKCLL